MGGEPGNHPRSDWIVYSVLRENRSGVPYVLTRPLVSVAVLAGLLQLLSGAAAAQTLAKVCQPVVTGPFVVAHT
jgi:hypothetical protein